MNLLLILILRDKTSCGELSQSISKTRSRYLQQLFHQLITVIAGPKDLELMLNIHMKKMMFLTEKLKTNQNQANLNYQIKTLR